MQMIPRKRPVICRKKILIYCIMALPLVILITIGCYGYYRINSRNAEMDLCARLYFEDRGALDLKRYGATYKLNYGSSRMFNFVSSFEYTNNELTVYAHSLYPWGGICTAGSYEGVYSYDSNGLIIKSKKKGLRVADYWLIFRFEFIFPGRWTF